MIERKECVICDCSNLKKFLDYNMPIFMGGVDEIEDYLFHSMKFMKCVNCNNIQIGELIEPELIYKNNHNIDIVGKTWKEHYIEFSKFIGNIDNKIILEISDPSAKIARNFDNFKKWYIIEPNPFLANTDKIIFINDFFNSNFFINENIDIIIHSHFFEHTYNPTEFLEKCYNILEENGIMFFSIPNLEAILEKKSQPNNILHFEHTFYYNSDIIKYLLAKNGFEIINQCLFGNHSIFYKVKKVTKKKLIAEFKSVSLIFKESYYRFKDKIDEINKSNFNNYILFGCHISSQFMIFNGLNVDKVKCIIDNSSSKENKYLYGTKLKTYKPENCIKSGDTIIISHSGIYFEEIKNSLLKINNNLNFI